MFGGKTFILTLGILGRYFDRFRSRPIPEGLPLVHIERRLGYRFRDPERLRQALTHRSVLQEMSEERSYANEQLEFLGDAVLELVVVDHIFRRFPQKNEGDLSKIKSMVVSGQSLEKISRRLHLGEYIIMSENEERNGGRTRLSILEDAFEAVVAAIYLDGGRRAAERFVKRNLIPVIDEVVDEKLDTNFKSQLLEYAQSNNGHTPVYSTISERGPDHEKVFVVEVSLNNRILARGEGKSKKAAQQEAARKALKNLNIVP